MVKKEEEPKEDREEKKPAGPGTADADKEAATGSDTGPGAGPDAGPAGPAGQVFPEPDFTTFMLSLSSSALMNLGLVNHPVTGKSEKDLPMAKHTIDILGMLKEKTSGNLTEDEKKLIENMLSELRLNYVKVTEKAPE